MGKILNLMIPSKNDFIIPAFQKLSSLIGKERVVWRYDPIFINEYYTIEYHKKYFQALCSKLSKFTEKCTVSFIDLYKNTARNIKRFNIQTLSNDDVLELMSYFISVAKNEVSI